MQFLESLSIMSTAPAHALAPAGPRHHLRLATRHEVQALVRRRYGARGLRVSGPGHAGLTFAACQGREIVATLGIALDGPAGLAADATFPAEVARLRRTHRLCEFTRLACDGSVPAAPVLAALFHGAYVAAHRLHAAGLMLLEVHPRHARFYQRHLHCRVVAGERPNRAVQAPAVLLAADAAEVRAHLRSECAARPGLWAHGFTAEEEDRVLCRLLLAGCKPVWADEAAVPAGPWGSGQDGSPRPAAVAGSLSLEETLDSLNEPR